MGYHFQNLDATTREFMLEEIVEDVEHGALYTSKRMTPVGVVAYQRLVFQALGSHNEVWLADQLSVPSYWQDSEVRDGVLVGVPVTAVETFAFGEFNRFYCRGLGSRAVAEGIEELEVYRARSAKNPRPESEDLIGHRFPSTMIRDDIRQNFGRQTAFGVGGPNSGLSLRIPL